MWGFFQTRVLLTISELWIMNQDFYKEKKVMLQSITLAEIPGSFLKFWWLTNWPILHAKGISNGSWKEKIIILTVCSSTFSLALHRTSAWDPEQRLLQVLGCFCSYLSTVEHRVSNLKATMHYALVMVSMAAFVCHAVIRKSDIEVASNSWSLFILRRQ